MSFWRVLWLLLLCIACDRTNRETTERADVDLAGSVRPATTCAAAGAFIATVGVPAPFTGTAAHVETTCGCKYAGDNRPVGCGVPGDTCDSEYDLGGPNPHECTDNRMLTEVEEISARADRPDCTVTVRVNADETSYSGTVTCMQEGGIVRVLVTAETGEGNADATTTFEVRAANGTCAKFEAP